MSEQKRRLLIPNSYQTPNVYADRYMALLTCEEWKVLSYTIRRTFGFGKQHDRISLTQYATGTVSRDGNLLDSGTGLSISAIRKALQSLIDFGLVRHLAKNNSKNEGALYALQSDVSLIRDDLLTARQEEQNRKQEKKTEKARQIGEAKRKGVLSDIRGDVGQQGGGDVGQQAPCCGTAGQYTV